PPELHIRMAESFIAPACLASLRLPGDALARPPERLAVWILEADGSAFRTGYVEAADAQERDQPIAFPAFENEGGARFLLFVADESDLAAPALIDRLRAFDRVLSARASITLDCNAFSLDPLLPLPADGLRKVAGPEP